MHDRIISLFLSLAFFILAIIPAKSQVSESFKSFPNDSSLFFDMLDHPSGKSNRTATASAVTVISPQDILKYDNVEDVAGLIHGRFPGSLGDLNIRGLGDALIIIDGLPRSINSIQAEEIEKITVLRDASASILYGTQAENGVILINTKRGAESRRISFNIVHGFDKPARLPNYLDAADYMSLYNEAQINDGLLPLYSDSDIQATRLGNNPAMYPDADYYNSDFLRDFKPTTRVFTEFSDGNENACYYVNAGYANSGTLLEMGEGKNEKDQRFNVRSNIDFKINKSIKSFVGIAAVYDITKRANGNFWSDAASLRPNLYPPLIDSAQIASQQSLKESATIVQGKYLLGGTPSYLNNMWGNLNLGGHQTQYNINVQFNTGVIFDLESVLKGLSAKTFIGLNYVNQYTEIQNNTYAVYQPQWISDEEGQQVLSVNKIGIDKFEGTQGVSDPVLARNMGFYGVLNYKRLFKDSHEISFTALAYAEEYHQTELLHPNTHAHLGARFNYSYRDKYLFELSGALVNSTKLPPANRVGLSPALSMSWVLSKERFLENSPIVDFLQIKAAASRLNSDASIPGYYLYEGQYSSAGVVTWNDNARSLETYKLEFQQNYDLFYEIRDEISLGIEACFFKNSLWLDAHVFQTNKKNLITHRISAYPDYLGGIYPYENYGENEYKGLEIGINWNQPIGNKLILDVGSSLTYLKTEVIERDEIFAFDYLYRTGHPVSSLFGLEAMGLFSSYDEIEEHEKQSFGQVQPGDIKYKDQNEDGIIDSNDQVHIGNYSPDFAGSLRINLQYKNLSLFAAATFIYGSQSIYNSEYYWIYGDRKYSEVVLNRWTEQTSESADYPRLTSMSNSNNFIASTFWLYETSRISLDRLQISYSIPERLTTSLAMKNLKFYIKAGNVAMFARNKEKMEMNIGAPPQYRNYMIGITAFF